MKTTAPMAIAGIARAGRPPADGSAAAETPLPQQLAELPATSQELFQQALAGLATMAPAAKPDAPMLVQLAEHLAIRFALERFDRGEVRVNSIRETLERASQEIATLRKILTGHEQALAKAGAPALAALALALVAILALQLWLFFGEEERQP